MASQKACHICVQLYRVTHPVKAYDRRLEESKRPWNYAPPPPLGRYSGQPMKRIYRRGSTRAYDPIGYICPDGHVILDSASGEPQHVLMPCDPREVLCKMTGEVVKTRGNHSDG